MGNGMEIVLKTKDKSDRENMERFMTLVGGIGEGEREKVLAFMQGINFGMELHREGGTGHE